MKYWNRTSLKNSIPSSGLRPPRTDGTQYENQTTCPIICGKQSIPYYFIIKEKYSPKSSLPSQNTVCRFKKINKTHSVDSYCRYSKERGILIELLQYIPFFSLIRCCAPHSTTLSVSALHFFQAKCLYSLREALSECVTTGMNVGCERDARFLKQKKTMLSIAW